LKFNAITAKSKIGSHSRGGSRPFVEIRRDKNSPDPRRPLLDADVAHVAQDLAHGVAPRGPGLELDDDNCARWITRGYVDSPRIDATFDSVIDYLEPSFEPFDRLSESRLHIALETEPLADFRARVRDIRISVKIASGIR